MVLWVCGGWRLSCAEQHSVAAATIIPRGAESSHSSSPFRTHQAAVASRPPSDSRGGDASGRSVILSTGSNDDFNKPQPVKLMSASLSMDAPLRNDGVEDDRGRRRSSSADNPRSKTKIGDLYRRARPLSDEEIIILGGSESSLSSIRSNQWPQEDDIPESEPQTYENPMYNGRPSRHKSDSNPCSGGIVVGGVEEGRVTTEGIDNRLAVENSGGRRNKQQPNRSKLSRSPSLGMGGADSASTCTDTLFPSSGRGECTEGTIFHSMGGTGADSIRTSIDAHFTSSGRKFYSHSNITPVRIGLASLPNLSSRELESSPMTATSYTFSRSNSIDGSLVSSASGASSNIKLIPAEKVTDTLANTPVLAPGAPMIERHKSRFVLVGRRTKSSSSFASTSFESGSADKDRLGRKGRISQSRRNAWGRSASSTGFKSSRGLSRSSSSGESAGLGGSLGARMRRVRAKMLSRSGSGTSSGSSNNWVGQNGPSFHSLRSLHSQHSCDQDIEAIAPRSSPDVENHGILDYSTETTVSRLTVTQAQERELPSPANPQVGSVMPGWWIRYNSSSVTESEGAAGGPAFDSTAAAAKGKAVADHESKAVRAETAAFGVDAKNNQVEAKAFSEEVTDNQKMKTRREPAGFEAGAGGDNSRSNRGKISSNEAARTTAEPSTARRLLSGRWVGDKSSFRKETPLTAAELKKEFDFDFEDDEELGEDLVNIFVRVSERVNKINSKMGSNNSGESGIQIPSPSSLV